PAPALRAPGRRQGGQSRQSPGAQGRAAARAGAGTLPQAGRPRAPGARARGQSRHRLDRALAEKNPVVPRCARDDTATSRIFPQTIGLYFPGRTAGEKKLSAVAVASIALGLILLSIILGVVLRSRLPETHLGSDSKDVIRLA